MFLMQGESFSGKMKGSASRQSAPLGKRNTNPGFQNHIKSLNHARAVCQRTVELVIILPAAIHSALLHHSDSPDFSPHPAVPFPQIWISLPWCSLAICRWEGRLTMRRISASPCRNLLRPGCGYRTPAKNPVSDGVFNHELVSRPQQCINRLGQDEDHRIVVNPGAFGWLKVMHYQRVAIGIYSPLI